MSCAGKSPHVTAPAQPELGPVGPQADAAAAAAAAAAFAAAAFAAAAGSDGGTADGGSGPGCADGLVAERSGECTVVDNGKDRPIRMLLPCCSPAVLLQ